MGASVPTPLPSYFTLARYGQCSNILPPLNDTCRGCFVFCPAVEFFLVLWFSSAPFLPSQPVPPFASKPLVQFFPDLNPKLPLTHSVVQSRFPRHFASIFLYLRIIFCTPLYHHALIVNTVHIFILHHYCSFYSSAIALPQVDRGFSSLHVLPVVTFPPPLTHIRVIDRHL